MPEDKKLKILLDSTLSKMHLQELDKDVKECLKSKMKEMNLQGAQSKDNRLAEDKRKRDEEESILAGKITTFVTNVAGNGLKCNVANFNFYILARPPSALENRLAATQLPTPPTPQMAGRRLSTPSAPQTTGARLSTVPTHQITKPGVRSTSEPRKSVPSVVHTTR